jgi:hypothetical protein
VPLVPEPSSFEDETAIEKPKKYKLLGVAQILEELMQAGGNTFCFEIHKLIHSVRNKEELPQQWKESIIVPIYENSDKTDYSNYRGISLQPMRYKILSSILVSRSIPYVGEIT